jgi:hypothetical protein
LWYNSDMENTYFKNTLNEIINFFNGYCDITFIKSPTKQAVRVVAKKERSIAIKFLETIILGNISIFYEQNKKISNFRYNIVEAIDLD